MAATDLRPFAEFHKVLVMKGHSPLPTVPGTKSPAIKGWSELCDEPLDPNLRERFARSDCAYGLGVALGYKNLVALDLDVEDSDIVAALRAVLPDTPVKKRGAKGATGFYRLRGAVSRRYRSTNGQMLIELLGPGCQTVLPPTVHPNGEPYRWIGTKSLWDVCVDELPELPSDICDRIQNALQRWLPAPPQILMATPTVRGRDRYRDTVIRARVDELARAVEGGRNHELNAAAFRLARLGLSQKEVYAILSPVADQIGLGRHETARTIASGWTAGSRQGQSHE